MPNGHCCFLTGTERKLGGSQKQRIIAMVCSDPPEGRARWTVRLVTREAVKRKLVPRVGRETVRVVLESHESRPWRAEKCGPAYRTVSSPASSFVSPAYRSMALTVNLPLPFIPMKDCTTRRTSPLTAGTGNAGPTKTTLLPCRTV